MSTILIVILIFVLIFPAFLQINVSTLHSMPSHLRSYRSMTSQSIFMVKGKSETRQLKTFHVHDDDESSLIHFGFPPKTDDNSELLQQ